ncbi:putative thiol:disulfide interchange protein [Novosphingobium sp. Rr 2-17]|uniref:TlpA family protein disulfide reductase n=1 Tax=Novosphingobium sp. Rr 2-17 TaxID=555793 RepID=UPI00026984E7|nr:TlpA disulfide reductase family protein [Novosphingobium sp. Rr 2-17]EIZ79983.1 putative thiol:disulfide interchange protein [Novosphingobium sp. Rr 2-17]
MTKRYMRAALAAVVGAAALTALPTATVAAKNKPVVGELAPDFELTMVDGSKVTLSQLKGQVVVLNFWATWCVPCRAELPTLDAYYDAQKQHGLKVIAITTEGSVPVGQLKKLFAAMRMPSARGIKGGYGPIGGAVPTNFVIDRAGKLRYAKAGAFDLDDLNKLLVPLLQEPAPS